MGIVDLSQAIQLGLKSYDVYSCRGNAYSQRGDHDKAIADYTEAIKLKPDFAEGYKNRGLAYEKKGDPTKADEDFAKAKEHELPPKKGPYPPLNRGTDSPRRDF